MTNDDTDPSTSPRDRYVDALLEHRFTESQISMERRVERVIRALRPVRSRSWQWWALPLAATLALSFLIMPTTGSASSLMKSAMRAAAQPGDRQYLITMTPVARRAGDAPLPATATLDVRDESHMRCEIRYPDGRISVRGRAGDVSWELHPNGDAVTFERNTPWPRWIETPDGSLLVDSMSSVLEGIMADYTVERIDDATTCDAQTRHLRALRTQGDDPKRPVAIDLCVDDRSGDVTRLEMTFAASSPGTRSDEPRRSARDGMPPPPPHMAGAAPPPGAPPPPHGGERRGPPPQSIIFEAVPGASFKSDWFEPPAGARPAPPRR